MLDTNIVSDMVRHPDGQAAKQFSRVGQHNIGVSIIVAAELRFGALTRHSTLLAAKLHELLERLNVMPFDVPAEHHYAEIRAQLEAAGEMIGGNDILIAAHALALGCTMVTDNEREFSRVKSLSIENWLR
ncbi:MAG TPA: type II toxin-antitoxin system VapC family toxin [Rhizomicrobium sp.]|jgi:tRNA(fMet)-specific endonuclease VapC|nr:type II toxin-antitoxin system VapC family toxin [Rhizomicrobium sp.]